jgi:hypothetical protein
VRTFEPTVGQFAKAYSLAIVVGTAVVWARTMLPQLWQLANMNAEFGFKQFMLVPIILMYPFMLYFAAIAAVLVGLPSYLILKRLFGLNILTIITMGLAVGLAIISVINMRVGLTGVEKFRQHLIGAAAGLSGSVTFYWMLATSNNRIERPREP